jgi:hypothetical protein
MYLVAIGALKGQIEDTLHPLAADLGTTPYELRLLLNAGLPAVVLATVDESLARAASAAISRHGHAPVFFDRRTLVPSARMTLLREPQFLPDELAASPNAAEPLPYADIAVLLKATHRTTSETTQSVKERKLRPVMAIATGGLVISKTVTRSVSSSSVQNEAVLYLFRHDSRSPWLLRERHAHYGGLGTALRPTSLENFAAVIRRLRELAPSALYDERLSNARPMRGVAEGIEATDLFAHLLALHLRSTGSGFASSNGSV